MSLINAFGLDNPLAIAWEVVPFSFVVDWFLPINRYLKNISALNGLELIHATVFKRSVSSYSLRTYQTHSGGFSTSAQFGDVYYSRSLIDQIPPENFEVPNLSQLIDSWKFETAFALLEQRRR